MAVADDVDLAARLEIYRHFAGTGGRPTVEQIAGRAGGEPAAVRATRLEPSGRRPQPDEMRGIFARAGLVDPLWDPRANSF